MAPVHDRRPGHGQLICQAAPARQNWAMKHESRLILAALGLTLLAGCLPTTLYYRAGQDVNDARRDEIACKRIALDQAPVEIEQEIIPGDITRDPPICDAAGNCRPGRAHRSPPRIIRTDVNKELRGLIERQCMADRGYQRVTLPACSDSVVKSVTPAVTRVMPPITGKACIIRRGSENYQIVPIAG